MKYNSYKGVLLALLELGKKIKQYRKEKKYSQDDLENYSNITKRTISKVENGFLEEVGVKKVEMILNLLGYELCIRPKKRPKTLEELRDER